MPMNDIIRSNCLGFCQALHIEPYSGIDNIISSMIEGMLVHPNAFWKPGTYWSDSKIKYPDQFYEDFLKEIRNFDKYYEGIQTRNIGSIILKDPKSILEQSVSSRYIISFRKIHEGYVILVIALQKSVKSALDDYIEEFKSLENEVNKLSAILFEIAPKEFKSCLCGLPTCFYLFPYLDNVTEFNKMLEKPSSEFHNFVQTFFCAQGISCSNLPRSCVENRVMVIRHPSYHYFPEMREKFLILPIEKNVDTSIIVRITDIFSSIEYYFTRFFMIIRAISSEVNIVDDKTMAIFPLLEKVRLPEASFKEAKPLIAQITSTFQELLSKYSTLDKVQVEAEHMFNDSNYLISGIVSSSSYSQITEKRLSDTIEGAAESIGLEMNMRLHHIRSGIMRYVGRSYSTISSASNLIHTHIGLLMNKTMVDYTRHIKYLTIIMAVLALITVLLTLLSISGVSISVLKDVFGL